jgi:hypothetical protein
MSTPKDFVHNLLDEHIAAVETFYEPLVTGNQSRLAGGNRLWGQFKDAIAAYRKNGKPSLQQVTERVNELVVARIILNDPAIPHGKVQYEPQIGAADRRIDFVVQDVLGENLYIEVKTVNPRTEDSDKNWEKYKKRRKMHTANTQYIVRKHQLGAEIHGNSFSARSKFMDYAREFETRLADAKEVQPGRGVLVFCGTGMAWDLSDLEDFADFYRTGRHLPDDLFSRMEAWALKEDGIELMRNIGSFGFVERPVACVTEEKWVPEVRGPLYKF